MRTTLATASRLRTMTRRWPRSAGGFVADVGDAADRAVAHELGDLVGEVVGVNLVGQFGDDEALAALDFLNIDDGALRDGAAAGAVGVFDALAA